MGSCARYMHVRMLGMVVLRVSLALHASTIPPSLTTRNKITSYAASDVHMARISTAIQFKHTSLTHSTTYNSCKPSIEPRFAGNVPDS